jgi:hypothetical protein
MKAKLSAVPRDLILHVIAARYSRGKNACLCAKTITNAKY